MIRCPNCSGELGLRERYERLLDLLESALILKRMNDRLEECPEAPTIAKAVIQASIQHYEQITKFWNDIPGDTLDDKLAAVRSRRVLERDENGKFTGQLEDEIKIWEA